MSRSWLLKAALAVAACLLSPMANAASPSFDCAKASTGVERLLCADAGLARKDRLLTAIYKRALERAGTEDAARIRAEQRAWAKARAQACPEGESAAACLEAIYAARIEAIRPLSFADLKLYPGANIQADRRTPLACLRFDAPLAPKQSGALESYVKSDGGEALAVRVAGDEFCIEGLAHGGRHRVTVRAGLAGESAVLRADVSIDIDIPDRPRRVAFPSQGLILPRLDGGGVPIETVNIDAVRVLLLRVDDSQVIDGLRRGLIDQQVGYSEIGRIASKLGQNIWSGEIEIDAPRNVSKRTAIPFAQLVPDLRAGVYLAVAEDPKGEFDEGWWTAAQWFVVSDIGLTTFIGGDGLTVAARSLQTAVAAPGARIVLKAESGATLAEATTDAAGIARIGAGYLRGEGEAAARAVYAYGAAGDFVYVDIARPPLDLSDRGVDGRQAPGALDAYLATDRGIYRPGDEVHMTALLRDAAAKAVEGLPLTLKVVRQDGFEVLRRVLQDKGAGGYSATLPLAPTAATGMWRATLHTAADRPPIGQVRFLVEDFTPPRLEVSMAAERAGSGIAARLSVAYLYGAPGAELPGEVVVDIRPSAEPVPGAPGYRFGLVQDEPPQSYQALSERFETDAAGHANLNLSIAEAPSTSYPLEAVVRASVFDVGGRPLTARSHVQLGNQPLLIGVKPLFEDDGIAEGGVATFDVMAFGDAGTLRTAELDYAIVREEIEYIWFENSGRWDYQTQYIETDVIDTGVLATASDAPARLTRRFEHWGGYRLDVRDRQSGAATSVRFHAGWWGAQTAEAEPQPDKVKVTLPPGPFHPGETIRIMIAPPFDAEIMASVVDSRVHDSVAASIPAGGGEIKLRLPANGAAGAYILVNAFAKAEGERSFAPRRAIGAAWAAYDVAPKSLEIALTAPTESLPKRTLDVRLALGGAEGRAFVTLAAVDDGVLGLTGYQPPDPKTYFLGKRRLGLELWDVYGRFIDAAGAAIGRVRTGGDKAMEARAAKADLADLPKKGVKVVALFSGVVETDANGVAMIPLAIPEFSGRIRLMAQAWTKDRVGAADTTLLVRRPVVGALALPQFLSPGDTAIATVSLRNLSGPAGRYTAKLTASGPLGGPLGPAIAADLDPGAPAVAQQYGISGVEPGEATLTLAVTGPDGVAFEIERTLPVRPAAPVETKSFKAQVAPGGVLRAPPGLLDGVYAKSARVVVGLNPLPDLDLPNILLGLARYPYGCAEQTTSTATPLLYASALAEGMGLKGAARPADAIGKGIERLLGMQTYTGGFGFWDSSYEARPWITVYATDFLVQAAAAGAAVPEEALARALQRLGALIDEADSYDDGQMAAAYALYVRARAGVADPARARRFANVLATRSPPPLTLAFTGAALAVLGDRSLATDLFVRAETVAVTEAPKTHYETYGSVVRNSAAHLALMAESGAIAWPQLEARAAALSIDVRGQRWLSTQEQAWVVRAAAALGRAAAASGFAVEVDGARVAGGGAGLYRTAAGANAVPILRNLGSQPVTGVVTVIGAATSLEPALDNGFEVARALFSPSGDPIDPGSLHQNDLVVVLIEGKQTAAGRAQALVVDYLPAGLELENAKIGGEDLGAYAWLGELTGTEHVELRDDRYIAAFDSSDRNGFRLAYLARAVTPGRFLQGGVRIEAMYQPAQFGRGAPATVIVSPR